MDGKLRDEDETRMTATMTGIVDCDLHPTLDGIQPLLPHLDDYWREQIVLRGVGPLDIASYPPKAPLTARKDWRQANGRAATNVQLIRDQALDPFGIAFGICNVVYGSQTVFNADFGVALCRATNDWLIENFLDRDSRLRGSIVVPVQDPDLAVEEIERLAGDRRFVQVLMPATAAMPLGHRYYWPIYRAAEKHGLPVGIHAAHANRFATTYVGWPSYFIEDYAAHSQTFEGQLLSLIYEGVFNKFPELKVVLIESGVTWIVPCLLRADTTWRSLRFEVPWLDRSPLDIAREHVRLTVQPYDGPADAEIVSALMDQLGSEDMLLFSSDYPHWQFDGPDPMPPGFSDERIRKMTIENPFRTYSRLTEVHQ